MKIEHIFYIFVYYLITMDENTIVEYAKDIIALMDKYVCYPLKYTHTSHTGYLFIHSPRVEEWFLTPRQENNNLGLFLIGPNVKGKFIPCPEYDDIVKTIKTFLYATEPVLLLWVQS